MSVSRRLRYEVLRRDGHRCRYCGASAPDAPLTVDHVVPVALGGPDEPSNLVTACADCNAGKSSSSPDAPIVEAVTEDALRWSRAMRDAAEIQSFRTAEIEHVCADLDDRWCGWTDPQGQPMPRPRDWRESIRAFIAAGLDAEVIYEMAEVAFAKENLYNAKVWKYFCGCCWRRIRERQEIAAALIQREDTGE